jgi:microcystin-dependent protein
MSQFFLGQIQSFGFNFAPSGWALCNGQILPITQNTALFSLLGTYYGGNGTSNFGLPNLQSRVPIHYGTPPGGPTYDLGEMAGVENVTIMTNEMPVHTHNFTGQNADANDHLALAGVAFANATPNPGVDGTGAFTYGDAATSRQQINPATLSPYVGGNLPHTNLQPYLTITWCIAMVGVFPQRS